VQTEADQVPDQGLVEDERLQMGAGPFSGDGKVLKLDEGGCGAREPHKFALPSSSRGKVKVTNRPE
jgi:hypothetical protein